MHSRSHPPFGMHSTVGQPLLRSSNPSLGDIFTSSNVIRTPTSAFPVSSFMLQQQQSMMRTGMEQQQAALQQSLYVNRAVLPSFAHCQPQTQYALDSRLSAFRPVTTIGPEIRWTQRRGPESQRTELTAMERLLTPSSMEQQPVQQIVPKVPDDRHSENLVQTLKNFLMPQSSSALSDDSGSSSAGLDNDKSPDGSCDPSKASDISQASFDGTTVLCQVCGDKASGFHYGVHACEGCKGFFRRSIQQKIQYRPCTKNQQCSILRINRNRCQYCRLKKCIAVGMSRDAVRFGRVPKKEKAKILAEMQRANTKTQVDSLAVELDDQDKLVAAVVSAHLHTCDFTRDKLLPVLAHYRQLGLSRQSSAVACPLNPKPLSPESGDDLSERYSPAIRGVVDFAKCIPGFHILSQEDQVTLLKAGMFEVLLLRLAVLFDSDNKSLMLLDGSVYQRDACPAALMSGATQGRFLVDSLFDFIDRFNSLCLNDADVAMFCAVVLVCPDRPGLRNQELVSKMHERLKGGLRKAIMLHHPMEPGLFQQLLVKVPDLRTLNTLHQEKLLTFNVDAFRPDIPPQNGCSKGKVASTGSSRTRSPLSDSRRDDVRQAVIVHEPNGAPSQWSTVCKASDASPSVSPSAGSRGSAEAAHMQTLHLSPGSNPQEKNWPAREAASFDSGKGTLSAKASSSSDSDSEDGVSAHRLPNMPTLKRALQAPPIATLNCPVSVRQKHQAVASLLEQKSSLAESPLHVRWPLRPSASILLSSRAAILQQSEDPRPPSINPAHSASRMASPKRPCTSEDEPLNLSKKANR